MMVLVVLGYCARLNMYMGTDNIPMINCAFQLEQPRHAITARPVDHAALTARAMYYSVLKHLIIVNTLLQRAEN